MKSLRVLSVLAIFILLATSAMPVLAKGQGPKDPNNDLARIETFEVVRNVSAREYKSRHPAALTEAVLAASGCKSYTLGRKGYSSGNVHLWTYSWTIDWCFNGSTVTSFHKAGPSVWSNWSWRFVRNTDESEMGGVNQTYYTHYGQGEFCQFLVVGGACVNYSYPYVRQTVRGDGTYSGSAGGS